MSAHKRDDLISAWVFKLREKSGWQKAAVALANKNARSLWAMMTKGQPFDARHVSVKPGGAVAPVVAPLDVAATSRYRIPHCLFPRPDVIAKMPSTAQTGGGQTQTFPLWHRLL